MKVTVTHQLSPVERAGYNHNVPYRGTMFHVQTELSTSGAPRVETHVFVGGRIVASRRREIVAGASSAAQRMKQQHKDVLCDLINNRLSIPEEVFGRSRPRAPASQRAKPKPKPKPPSRQQEGRSVLREPPAASGAHLPELLLRQAYVLTNHRLLVPGSTIELRKLGTAFAMLLGAGAYEQLSAGVLLELLEMQQRLVGLLQRELDASSQSVQTFWRDCAELRNKLTVDSPIGSRARFH